MSKENEAKTEEKTTYVIKGILKNSFVHIEKNEDGSFKGSTNVITLKKDVFNDADLVSVLNKIYEHTADKWIPSWFKDMSRMTLKSSYNIPVKIMPDAKAEDGEQGVLTFEQFVKRGYIEDAFVEIKCNVKDSALYPSAMKVLKDGREYDPFADF